MNPTTPFPLTPSTSPDEPESTGSSGLQRSHWTDRLEKPGTAALFVAALVMVCCFLGLGGHGVISMEGMIIDGASHMLDHGDWSVPHVYGEQYTFKPSLAYWLSAGALTLSDRPSELLLRLPFALSGVALAVGLMLLVGRRLGARAGAYTAAAVLGGPLFLDKIRIAEFDVPLAAGVGLAVGAACLALTSRRDSLPLWIGTYLALAVGFLAKGSPALMAYAPGLLLGALVVGELPRLWGWRHVVGGSLFVVAIGGYLLAAINTGGTDVFTQPGQEAGWRVLEWDLPSLLRTPLKPLLMLAAFLPWSLLLFLVPGRLQSLDDPHRRLLLASLGFLGGGALAFAIVPTHEMRYYLPLIGGAAIAAGTALDALTGRVVPRPFTLTLKVLGTLAVAGALVAAGQRSTTTITLVMATLSAILLWFLWNRQRSTGRATASLLVGISVFLALGYALVVVPGRASNRDRESVAEVFDPLMKPGETIWVLTPSDTAGKHSSLYFYLDHPVRTYGADSLPPAGAAVMVVDGNWPGLEADLETLAEVDAGGYRYRLTRIDGSRREGSSANDENEAESRDKTRDQSRSASATTDQR